MKKILIRMPNWLGDVVMATSFVDAVLKQFPQAQVDLMIISGLAGLPLAHRGEIISWDKKGSSLSQIVRTIKSRQYERVYILPPSFSSAWIAFWAGIPERYGLVGDGRKFLLKPSIQLPHAARSVHLIKEYYALLPEWPQQNSPLPLRFELNQNWLQEQIASLSQPLPKNYWVISPGVIFGPAKQWPLDLLAQLLDKVALLNKMILLTGTTADAADAEVLCAGRGQVLNWCGKTNLTQLIAVLSHAELLLSNDSGAMHLGAALHIPQIAIFGSTSPIWTGPWNERAEVIYQKTECSPCFQKTCRYGHYQCLRQISPEQIFIKIEQTLQTEITS